MQGPMKLMHDGYMRSGEVFTVPVLHKNFTFLLGPHVSGHFFKANDDEMSQKEVSNMGIIYRSGAKAFSLQAWQICTSDVKCSLACRSTNSMFQRLGKGWYLMWITR